MMQAHTIPVFKSWVTEWVARSVIGCILMTCLFCFAFYSSPSAVMGYYGIQPADAQYGMVVVYGSTAAFLALDFRIVKYFAPRKYLLTALSLNSLCSVLCFHFKSWTLFVSCQFLQGITCALMSGIVLQLIFPRLHTARVRVIAYSLLYGCIQIAVPFYAICSSIVLHYLDFNWLFYGFNILLVILVLIVLCTMNSQARFTKKIPLYQIDWTGYLLYVCFILTLGYILVYGRQSGWLDSTLIQSLTTANIIMLFLFIIRALKLKRPLIDLQIFKAEHFIMGLLLLFVFYIFKGTTGLAYGHLEVILGADPLNTIPIWTAVITGTILSMSVTARFVLMGYNLIRIIIIGFGMMALYYALMIQFVSLQGQTKDFILPLFIYGAATGVLFVPIVLFTVSSAPREIAIHASLVGILARFTGFTASLAISNEMQLSAKAAVREKLREAVTEINPQLPLAMQDIESRYLNAGSDVYVSKKMASVYFNQMNAHQIAAMAARDYYDWMLAGVIAMIIILLLLPRIQTVVLKLRKGNIPY